jgi:AcrR family transcriptional regulator
MVSRRRAPGDSRARLLEAAAYEFATRGFDGATVDRIAGRARVNKAMVYYHFTNKAALYREILRDVFGAVAAAVEAVPAAGGPPEAQMRGFIEAVATHAAARPHFPSIWLRELAEGGRHLDDSVVAQMRRVMQAFVAILAAGRRAGRFREVQPLIAHMSIVGPLLVFAASALVRDRLRDRSPFPTEGITWETVLAYVQDAALATLTAPRSPAARVRPARRGMS